MTGAVVCRIGICRSEHGHVLPGSAQPGIHFVALMDPDFRQTIGDGMIVANRDLKRYAQSMAAGGSRSGVGSHSAVLPIPERSGTLTSAAPASHANHLVKCRPIRKCII